MAKVASDAVLLPCLYCASNHYKLLFKNIRDRLSFVDGMWQFWRCIGCGSVILSPFPNVSDLLGFYPHTYTFTPELGNGSRLKEFFAKCHHMFLTLQYVAQIKQILKTIGVGPNPRLLDIGCGSGMRLALLRKRGFDVEGVDFRKDAVNFVKESLGIPAFCISSLSELKNFPRKTYDIITAFYLVEHVADVKSLLGEIFALVKPGGWVMTAVPVMESVEGKLLKTRWNQVTEAPRHVSIPSHKGMATILVQAGFKEVTYRPDSTLNNVGIALLSLLPRLSATHMYKKSKIDLAIKIMVGLVMALVLLPWCALTNALKRGSVVMVFARKPACL